MRALAEAIGKLQGAAGAGFKGRRSVLRCVSLILAVPKGGISVPKISVIVPVYNVEAYLDRCIESVLAQTFTDYELLLVDDGSTDGSGAICARYAGEYPSLVRTLTQRNAGQGIARSAGIAAARGEYLFFLDSDDYIAPDALGELYALAEAKRADLILFGLQYVSESGAYLEKLLPNSPQDTVFSLDSRPELLLEMPSVCTKLVRRALFTEHNLSFPREWYEDLRVSAKLYAIAQNVVCTGKAFYFYFMRSGSTMRNTNAERNGEIITAFDDILTFYKQHGLFDRYRSELEYLAVNNLFIAASVRVLRMDVRHPLLTAFHEYMRVHFPACRENAYLRRAGRKTRLIFSLLEKKRYKTLALLFRLNDLRRRRPS